KAPHQRMPSLRHTPPKNTDYDMIIYVGKEPSIRTFNAHSDILRDQSSYFLAALSSRWVQRENGMIVFRKPNISPEVFETILRYEIFFQFFIFFFFIVFVIRDRRNYRIKMELS